MFDVGIAAWGEDGAFERPCFVVTHHPREPLVRGRTTFHFTSDNIHAVIARAKQVAAGRDVLIAGGANIARQCLAAGLVDEVRLHVVPVLLGDGVRLFDDAPSGTEFELLDVSTSRNATHLVYAVRRQSAANAALNVALGRIAADTLAMSGW
jgi:dihydrofolate reductase